MQVATAAFMKHELGMQQLITTGSTVRHCKPPTIQIGLLAEHEAQDITGYEVTASSCMFDVLWRTDVHTPQGQLKPAFGNWLVILRHWLQGFRAKGDYDPDADTSPPWNSWQQDGSMGAAIASVCLCRTCALFPAVPIHFAPEQLVVRQVGAGSALGDEQSCRCKHA